MDTSLGMEEEIFIDISEQCFFYANGRNEKKETNCSHLVIRHKNPSPHPPLESSSMRRTLTLPSCDDEMERGMEKKTAKWHLEVTFES